MPERAGHDGFEDRGVEHEHRARDGREPDGEQHEQFGARELARDRAGSEAALRSCRGRSSPRGPAPPRRRCPSSCASAHAKPFDDHRQHAPMPQQRRQRRDHDHQRQYLERETGEIAAACVTSEGRVAAADIAEHERRARLRRRRQRIDHAVQREQHIARHRHFQQQQRKPDLQRQPHRHRAQRERRAGSPTAPRPAPMIATMPRPDCRWSRSYIRHGRP